MLFFHAFFFRRITLSASESAAAYQKLFLPMLQITLLAFTAEKIAAHKEEFSANPRKEYMSILLGFCTTGIFWFNQRLQDVVTHFSSHCCRWINGESIMTMHFIKERNQPQTETVVIFFTATMYASYKIKEHDIIPSFSVWNCISQQ